jgi:hypothetical protein
MSAKTFLLQECKNVDRLLKQTLRFEYGADGSQGYYEECATRLAYIDGEICAADEQDSILLGSLCRDLNELSRLICRIERSSLGEYSWPFVEELKVIATAICTEANLSSSPPQIFVLADGGLDCYAIYPEQRKPSTAKRLLLTIVFPKSLKHFVLLHTILGHELGHALWRCSQHQQALKRNVLRVVIGKGSLLESSATIEAHLLHKDAPKEVADWLLVLQQNGINKGKLFEWANYSAWIEEILCDLIGLMTFGPGFAAALRELLYGLDGTGVEFGPNHPLTAWRVNMILRCAELLGYDKSPAGQGNTAPVDEFWRAMKSARRASPWFDVFTDDQLVQAIAALQKILGAHPPALYPDSDEMTIDSLCGQLKKHVPPVGFALDAHREPVCAKIDFRHIIYAGWIVSESTGASIPFDTINKLCEHAIMQQRAIQMIGSLQ